MPSKCCGGDAGGGGKEAMKHFNERRTKKLRSALSYLEKALEIEYNYLHFSYETVDECLQVSNPCDIHLNICAILSQMSKHELALQHAMKALILI